MKTYCFEDTKLSELHLGDTFYYSGVEYMLCSYELDPVNKKVGNFQGKVKSNGIYKSDKETTLKLVGNVDCFKDDITVQVIRECLD